MPKPKVEVAITTNDNISYSYLVFINEWQLDYGFPAGTKESANTFLNKFKQCIKEVVVRSHALGREDFKRDVKDLFS